MKTTRMKTLSLAFVAAAAVVTGLAAPALAQEATPPPATAPAPEVKRTGRTSGDVGSGGLGLGGTVFVSGLAGPEIVYDFGGWHIDGVLAFASFPANMAGDRATQFAFGIGGWYHLHLGENSDFSVGGAFGLETFSPPGPGANSSTGFEFEPGAQVRAFITPNVALHGGMAIVLAFGDQVGGPNASLNKQIQLAAGVTGNFGFTYYFR